MVVRLGKNDAGAQIEFNDDLDHISVWCEDFTVCTPAGAVDIFVGGSGPTASCACGILPTATRAALAYIFHGKYWCISYWHVCTGTSV